MKTKWQTYPRFALLSLCVMGFSIAPLQGLVDEPETHAKGLPLFYWNEDPFVNFGDYLSYKIVERIVGNVHKTYIKKTKTPEKMLLALGSVLYFARENDVVWASGYNGKYLRKSDYAFAQLDVRAVRGPMTRAFLKDTFEIECPEIYGDPALLMPYLFPEFQRAESPSRDYIVIPHYSERKLFSKDSDEHIVHPTDPWDYVVRQILDSQFVISSSLHGIIVAEAYGIPARLLRVTEKEPIIKYQDYYFGTNRPDFQFATSIEEALRMGGEPPFECDLQKLYETFPFEFWPNSECKKLNFPNTIKNPS